MNEPKVKLGENKYGRLHLCYSDINLRNVNHPTLLFYFCVDTKCELISNLLLNK